ncbi:MAG: hypothetical protein AAFX99_14125 [Myxococcota bacterium]
MKREAVDDGSLVRRTNTWTWRDEQESWLLEITIHDADQTVSVEDGPAHPLARYHQGGGGRYSWSMVCAGAPPFWKKSYPKLWALLVIELRARSANVSP